MAATLAPHRQDCAPAAPEVTLQTAFVDVDERAARRSLRDQIARLERELAEAFVAAFPRAGLHWSVPARGGPQLLTLGELEVVRDALSGRAGDARRVLEQRALAEEQNRRLVERMMLEPGRHKFVRVSRADIGEPGCGGWEVRPRLGIIGMLAGWWHVKLSSGCPLAMGSGRPALPASSRISGVSRRRPNRRPGCSRLRPCRRPADRPRAAARRLGRCRQSARRAPCPRG